MKKKSLPIRITFSKKKKLKGRARTGSLYLIAVLGLITAAGVVAVGGATPTIRPQSYDPEQGGPTTCCDSGDGAACRPLEDQTVIYSGKTYGLLKSNITIDSIHLHGSNEFDNNGQRIFINTTDTTADYTYPGCEKGKDLIDMEFTDKFPQPCLGIPNDEIVYVCASKDGCENPAGKSYNAFYRLSDGPVPKPIAYLCPKPSIPVSPKQGLNSPQGGEGNALQIGTFQLKDLYAPLHWLEPYPNSGTKK